MKRLTRRTPLVLLLALSACGPPGDAGESASETAAHEHAAELPASDGPGFKAADVRFMQMMIGHHAQALTMSGMAPTHGAGPQLLMLAQKIDISQTDEIAMMEQWLRDRDQAVPDATQRHAMSMPGMVTQEQLAELDAERGRDFDRLFLTLMIQHHQGALVMVNELFRSPGAAQDSDIFRFITDVSADQGDEIYAMETLLYQLDATPGSEFR